MSEEKPKYLDYLYHLEDLPYVELTKGSMSKLIVTDKVLVSFIENAPGCNFPVHSHEAEQILVILEGEEDHVFGDETFLMKAGDVCVHPSNVPHGGTSKTGYKGIDIFCPPRPDHVEKLKKVLEEQKKKEEE